MSEEKPEYDSEVYMICGIDAPPVRRPLQIAPLTLAMYIHCNFAPVAVTFRDASF
ncbi:hypothetical protein FB451DRAFT_1413378 [Mycena latifolia]|nr:hypothetical protein FB451DRAFT_1413378 [Mycena latifolia]